MSGSNKYKLGTQKYWCDRCKIFVTDNKPSRQLHENGTKHKQAVEEYLRDMHKRGDQKRIEDLKTRDMLLRIERAATRQYAQDMTESAPSSSGTATAPSSIPPSMYPRVGAITSTYIPPQPSAPSSSSSNIVPTGYTGGIRLEDNSIPVEVAPDADQGIAGVWTSVPSHQQVLPSTRSATTVKDEFGTDDVKPDVTNLRKEAVDEDEAGVDFDVISSLNWKVVEKVLNVDDGVGAAYNNEDEDEEGVVKAAPAFKKRKVDKPRNIRKK
ncbi:hypothetical protein SmJEL517_g01480 [Synchytrium microbalum]|uniref:Matrin-type domain-containing protein n=1 Tax=Synchytrium microbalum TaxID=1806994 RepID=A0A507CFM9_9FUNG|nr:uncharacterized protein SmJEL517_g01480 [Synchytrium microbalum]TPX36313.1 hypothetical protein SmJEL517_g01480 [Synchytrium microbalum]